MIKQLFTLGLALAAFTANAQTAKLKLNTKSLGSLHKNATSTLRTHKTNSVSSTDSTMYTACSNPFSASTQLYIYGPTTATVTTGTDPTYGPYTQTVYGGGYDFGTNHTSIAFTAGTIDVVDNEFAQKYNIVGSAQITDVLFLADKISAASTNTVVANIYSEDATTLAPSTLLGTSSTLALSALTNTDFNDLAFSTPVDVSNQNFFASVVVPMLGGPTNDTLSLLATDYSSCPGAGTDSLSWYFEGDYEAGALLIGSWASIENGLIGGTGNLDFSIYPVLTISSSGINKVTKGGLSLYAAYPNPANSSININFSVEKAGSVQVQVYDITGKMVKTINNNATSGKNNIAIDVTNIEAGSYMYSINVGGTKMFSKFVVTK